MNEEKAIYRPCIGMRFLLRGNEFEVCFVDKSDLRYAASNGGKQFNITWDRFFDLQRENEIEILNTELHGQNAEGGVPSVANMTDSEMDEMMRRLRYAEGAIKELSYPNSPRVLKAWIPEFSRSINDDKLPSPSSVSRWVRKLLMVGKDAFMAPERKRGNRSLKFAPEIELLILEAVDSFLVEERRDCKDVLAYIVGKLAEKDMLTKDDSITKVPCEKTVARLLKKIDPYLLVRLKKGALAAERTARAAGKQIKSPRAMHWVEIDTHFLKVNVVDPDTRDVLGTPYLVCAFDVRTRCVVGIYVSLYPASTITTLAVVKDMLVRPESGLPGGIPVFLIPDNGIEFRNSSVKRLMGKLNVNFEPSMIRDPNGKAHVESFFRTLSLFLIQKIRGTTFSGEAKNEYYDSEGNAYATLEVIEDYIMEWVECEYHQRPHSMTGRIPIKHWEEEIGASKPLSLKQEDVDVLARRAYRRKINSGQVQLINLVYYSHALSTLEAQYTGHVTVLVNELDLSSVLVEHPVEKGVLIKAESVDPEYTQGLTMWEHREAQKEKAKMTRKDILAVGKYASLLARYRLLERIQKDSKFARSKIAKLTQGKGKKSHTKPDSLHMAGVPIQPSALEAGGPPRTLAEQEKLQAPAKPPSKQTKVSEEEGRELVFVPEAVVSAPKRKNTIYTVE